MSTDSDVNSMIDVLIIGGGPCGLLTAIELKLLRPHLRILVYEKHAQYQRTHVLQLDPTTFHGIPSAAQQHQTLRQLHVPARSRAWLSNWNQFSSVNKASSNSSSLSEDDEIKKQTNALEDLVNEWNQHSYIATSTIEHGFKTLALKLNITIVAGTEVNELNWEELVERSSAKLIIGADGSRSITRQLIFGDRLKFEENVNHIIELKYRVQGIHTRPLHKFSEAYKALKLTDYLVLEQVGRPNREQNYTPISIFCGSAR